MLTTQHIRMFSMRLVALARRHWGLMASVVAFAVLGTLYASVTPVFEASNEPCHYLYTRQLFGRAQVTDAGDLCSAEFRQPPLYYAIGAVFTAWGDDGGAHYQSNPHAVLGLPGTPHNRNALLHTGPDEALPGGVIWRVRLLRLLSVIFSLGTVVLTYAMVEALLPGRRDLSLGTTALVAFNPQFLFISSTVNNVALVVLIITALFYVTLRLSNGTIQFRHMPVALGIGVGLAALAHSIGWIALLLLPGALALAEHRRTGRVTRDAMMRPVLIATGVSLLIGLWWYGLHASAYWRTLIGGDRADGGAAFGGVAHLVQQTFLSYWGVFGWANVPADELFYNVMRILTILGGSGLLIILAQAHWRRLDMRRYVEGVGLFPAYWVAVVGLSFVFRTVMGIQPQGQMLFPAIAAISFFIFVGVIGWISRRYRYTVTLLFSGVLFAVSAAVPFRYIAPTYSPPQRLTMEQVPESIHDLHIRFGDEMVLLGYSTPHDGIKVGNTLTVRLYWLALKRIEKTHTMSMVVLGREGEQIGRMDSYPGAGGYPTHRWIPGEVIVDDYAIPIDADAAAPTAGVVRLSVRADDATDPLMASDLDGQSLGGCPKIMQLRIAPPVAEEYAAQYPVKVGLGQQITLLGYDLSTEEPAAGDTWGVTLYWLAMRSIEHDYTVFIHLVDEEGEIVAQVDSQPVHDDYPTSLWRLNEQVRDHHLLQLPDDLPAGQYTLRVGLYRLETSERLPVSGSEPSVDYVTFEPVNISAS